MSYFETKPYAVVVIGAGSGIGRAAAEFLGAQGVSVACLDRDLPAAEDVAQQIRGRDGEALALAADVTVDASINTALDRVDAVFGRIHGLVNCAGITGRTNLKGHEVDLADFDAVYQINLRGAMVVSKAVLPRMLKYGYGRLLHVASIAGKEGNAGMAAYSATKAGLIGLVKSLGKDYAETGVTINALAPAVIRTPLVEELPETTVTYMTEKIPMRRCGTLEEAAQMIAWIVSPACSFTTGFTFDLSGGRATY
ncbi:SDR family oxidoreductase [Rhodospirillaceae bacterium SYSU D60014]|uniref:SDR family NAD(P)-dependent oxidoreductase n=1 Tax=Virgifigura deserti TaxID=2268457 RepID=UPI000E663817